MSNTYKSGIELGKRYRDKTTGAEGTAISIHFYKNACERVVLTYLHDGEIKEFSFDAVDLIDVETQEAIPGVRPGGPSRSMPTQR